MEQPRQSAKGEAARLTIYQDGSVNLEILSSIRLPTVEGAVSVLKSAFLQMGNGSKPPAAAQSAPDHVVLPKPRRVVKASNGVHRVKRGTRLKQVWQAALRHGKPFTAAELAKADANVADIPNLHGCLKRLVKQHQLRRVGKDRYIYWRKATAKYK